ncbi:UNVERIFIED_CONTAM: hypothetical protein ABID98_002174 [Brevibacillus sp. OAP136]
MQRLTQATVIGIVEERTALQIVSVELNENREIGQALYYAAGAMPCRIGDQVLVNTTAVRQGLGTGGYHFIVSKVGAEEADYLPNAWGHIVKMRYSPLQLTVPAVEEEESPHHSLFLERATETLQHVPVVIGELHSLLPIICLAIHNMENQQSRPLRVAFVMPDGASLPIAISRHVYQLREQGMLAATVTTGQAWGGDLEAINIYTGLLAARHVAQADVIVCLLGPGVAGTATRLGFSGMQLVEVMHAAATLGGVPLVVPRISFSDQRDRHVGISHHTITMLSRHLLLPVVLPLPVFSDSFQSSWVEQQLYLEGILRRHAVVRKKAPDVDALLQLQERYPLLIETMGRGIAVDPTPFQAAYCAASCAARLGEAIASGDASLATDLPPEALVPYYADWLNRAM